MAGDPETFPHDPDPTGRLRAIGAVVEAAAELESTLRRALCALVGSKYAAILCAGQPTSTLLNQSLAVLKAHREIAEEPRAALHEVLVACGKAIDRRHPLVHDVWGHGPGDVMVLIASRRNDHRGRIGEPMAVEDIESIERELSECDRRLSSAVRATFGHELATLEAQLRWEEYVASMPLADVEAMVRRRALDAGISPAEVDSIVEQVAAGLGRAPSSGDVAPRSPKA